MKRTSVTANPQRAMSEKLIKAYKAVENGAVNAYMKIEKSTVEAYKRVEDCAVNGYHKIEDVFTGSFLDGASASESVTTKQNNIK